MATEALLQRLAAVRGRLSLCADQAAAAKWWLSMPMASVSAEGPMPKALSTRRTSPLMPGCRHQGRACPLRRARMTSNPLILCLPSDQHYPKNKQDNAQQADTGDRINRDTKKAIVIEHQGKQHLPDHHQCQNRCCSQFRDHENGRGNVNRP